MEYKNYINGRPSTELAKKIKEKQPILFGVNSKGEDPMAAGLLNGQGSLDEIIYLNNLLTESYKNYTNILNNDLEQLNSDDNMRKAVTNGISQLNLLVKNNPLKSTELTEKAIDVRLNALESQGYAAAKSARNQLNEKRETYFNTLDQAKKIVDGLRRQ